MLVPLNLLLVEDSEKDAELLVEHLRDAQFEPQIRRAQGETDYLAALRPDLDLIISDFTMPNFDGLRALDLLNIRGYDIPFILFSGTISMSMAQEAIRRGAADCLTKDEPDRLGRCITRALQQKKLRQSSPTTDRTMEAGERKFRALFDAANDSIYMLHNGIFIDCNAKGLFMFGRTWDEIVGHSPDEFAPPTQPDGRNSRDKAIEIVQRALAGEAQVFEWTSVHANGKHMCSEVSLNRLEMGGTVYLMAVARDITERKKAEEQIAEQAALLDQARDAIVVRELGGQVLFWNKGAERLYGWTHDEALGRNVAELYVPDPSEVMACTNQVLEQGEWYGEVQQRTKDGYELMIEVRLTLLRDGEGRPKSIMAINTDVTEKRAVEAQLMRAQRIESIGTLAGGIAHDLNNILTPILTSIETLRQIESDPRSQRILDTIEASSRRGAEIVQQVLSFSRGIKGQRVEVRPGRLLSEIESFIRPTFPRNIELKIFVGDGCWPVLGDPTQLHQILLNLSLNARDAMPDGGRLTISAENVDLDERTAARYLEAKPGRYVILTVADTGMGIPPEVIDKIFEPFFTTKEIGKGTGLGLSTVVAITKGHDGFLDLHSAPNRGTEFNLFLPALQPRAGERDDSAVRESFERGHGETVLVVDDEEPILAITCETLEAFGYRTLRASDGAEAVRIYERHAGEISVVLTDITMPKMDGPATIRTLREINPSVKCIVSSGYLSLGGSAGNRAPLAQSGNFLPKPYTAETLLNTVRRALEGNAVTGSSS